MTVHRLGGATGRVKNRELKTILRRCGYVHTRSRGDHHIYHRPGTGRPIVLFGDDGTEAPEWQMKRVRGLTRECGIIRPVPGQAVIRKG